MDRMSSEVSARNPAGVVVIDDHDIVRFGLETLIRQCAELRFAGSAPSLREGLELIRLHAPALVITDMGTADSHGPDTVRAVVAAQQPRATLVLSMQEELLYGEQVLALGARGHGAGGCRGLRAAVCAARAGLHRGAWPGAPGAAHGRCGAGARPSAARAVANTHSEQRVCARSSSPPCPEPVAAHIATHVLPARPRRIAGFRR
jgi:DNA-binding NarL/FixJ family response regulator